MGHERGTMRRSDPQIVLLNIQQHLFRQVLFSIAGRSFREPVSKNGKVGKRLYIFLEYG